MDTEPKPDSNRIWITGTIIAALIGCVGVLGAALITVLFNNSKSPQSVPAPVAFTQSVDTSTANSITDSIAGNWTGTIQGISDDFSAEILVFINKDCKINDICGTYSAPSLPCSGNLILSSVDNATFIFVEQKTGGADFCGSGGFEHLELLPDNTLSWGYSNPGESIMSKGILER